MKNNQYIYIHIALIVICFFNIQNMSSNDSFSTYRYQGIYFLKFIEGRTNCKIAKYFCIASKKTTKIINDNWELSDTYYFQNILKTLDDKDYQNLLNDLDHLFKKDSILECRELIVLNITETSNMYSYYIDIKKDNGKLFKLLEKYFSKTIIRKMKEYLKLSESRNEK